MRRNKFLTLIRCKRPLKVANFEHKRCISEKEKANKTKSIHVFYIISKGYQVDIRQNLWPDIRLNHYPLLHSLLDLNIFSHQFNSWILAKTFNNPLTCVNWHLLEHPFNVHPVPGGHHVARLLTGHLLRYKVNS